MNRTVPLRRPQKVRGPRSSSSILEPGWLQRVPDGAQGDCTRNAKRSLSQPGATSRLTASAYLEIVVLGGLVPAALLWFCWPQSLPLVLPALVLIPLLLGLHYGFLAGACGALLTAGVLAAFAHLKPDLLSEFPRTSVIGLLLVGMGAGEARDIWAAQLRRLNYLCNYHQTRLKQFTSDYQLLKVSHSQLERRLAGSANSLRAALERLKLREPVSDAARSEPMGGIGGWLLEIMAEAGNLHTAALYETSGRGILRLPSVAMLGKATDLSPFNPLLRETLRTGSLTSVHAGHEAVHEPVIAVVPLIDASGHIHGVVSINEMPFLSIHQDTFELLGVLGRHIGDVLARQTRPMGDTQGPFTLRESLQRNLVDAKSHGLPAALIACKVVDAARRDSLVAHCCNGSRGLDQSWISVNREGKTVILKLLPLTDEIGVKSYLARMESMQAGAGAAMHGIVTYLWTLDKNQTADELLEEIRIVCDFDPLLDRSVQTNLNFPSEAAL
jgi:polysaccharide biosynthesis protein PelD